VGRYFCRAALGGKGVTSFLVGDRWRTGLRERTDQSLNEIQNLKSKIQNPKLIDQSRGRKHSIAALFSPITSEDFMLF
jgi:hypothetical protein